PGQQLLTLVQTVVAPGTWGPPVNLNPAQQLGVGPPAPQAEGGPADINFANNIYYYIPARVLVVRGTSRKTTKLLGGALGTKKKGAVDGAAADNERIKQIADKVKGGEVDASVVWQQALDQAVPDLGIIIATADFLFEQQKYDHAAELLKANLRNGLVV